MSRALNISLTPFFVIMVLVAFQVGTSFAADSQRTGAFAGRSDHVTSGGVTVAKSGDAVTLTLHGNFSLDGAPDPWIGFGKAGRYVKSTQFAKLKKLTGQQTYAVPASVDISAFDEVYIWCHKFSAPLGVAKLR